LGAIQMKFFFLVFFSIFAYGQIDVKQMQKELDIQAIQQKWTFEYQVPVREYRTGLLNPGLQKGKKEGKSFDALKEITDELPKKFDWREKVKIGDIRDQGSCGSCWSFSLTSVVNDIYMIFAPSLYKGQLSEQYLVSCASDNYGCDGGFPSAMKWMVTPKGAPLLSEWPYTATNGRCNLAGKTIVGSIIEWNYVGTENLSVDEKIVAMKKAIFAYGPISTTVAANGSFSAYKSGVYNACNSSSTNHMTNVVGWDDDTQSWIMRNSWGKEWGEQGYMKIKWKGNNGQLCNSLGEDSVFAKIKNDPVPPPMPKEFEMVFETVKLKVTIEPTAKYTVEDFKKVTTNEVEDLEEDNE